MSKREASMFAAQGVDVDAPRAKRHKTAPAPASPSSPKKESTATSSNAANGDHTAVATAAPSEADREAAKEKGLALWQTVKDAVDKEGRTLSHTFLRLPSKRQYPDYYQQIKRPVALDDIKQQLDAGAYATFEDVKQDFDTCFRNAKRYNMKESQIWKDAKHLHKVVQKESTKLSGVEGANDGDENGVAGSDGEDEGGKKKKPPNMNRLLKSRLQKLVDKEDAEGRKLAAEFLDLPSKKQWPLYYKTIKKPQCIEAIFKHLKRKEYHTSTDFATDVELVFSNALEFNQEHTQIWEDALVLRDYFRQLMSDLPPQFAIPAYSTGDHSTKIKLKMPGSHPAPPAPPQTTATPSGSTSSSLPQTGLVLRVPGHAAASGSPPGPAAANKSPTAPPATAPASTPAMSPLAPPSALSPAAAPAPPPPTPAPTTKPVIPTPISVPSGTGNLQPATFNTPYPSGYSQHYPNATYQATLASAAAAAGAPAPSKTTTLPNTNAIHPARRPPPPPVQIQTHTVSVPSTSRPSPAAPAAPAPAPPVFQNDRQLRFVCVTTQPLGRRLDLDRSDGVKTWAVRLGARESGVRIAGVKFLSGRGNKNGEQAGDDSDEEMEGAGAGGEAGLEEEEVVLVEEEAPKEKPKRGRGRPRKKAPEKAEEEMVPAPVTKVGKGKAAAKGVSALEEVQVKLNGVVRARGDGKREWEFDLPIGSNVVEIEVKNGMSWKVYMERVV